MSSPAYFLGLFLGDYCVYCIPQIILVGFYYMSTDTIANVALKLFGVMLLFGAPFISLNYVIGFLFKRADSSFKYSVICTVINYAIPLLTGALVGVIT